MGNKRGANCISWKNLGYRDHLEDVGLYGRKTLNSIFRLIQIIHMTPGNKVEKINH